MNFQLTDGERRYYKENYSTVVAEGIKLFKRSSLDVLSFVIETLDPMIDTRDIMSRKTLLTMAAVAYAESELMKDIIKERNRNEAKTVAKNKFDLSEI